MQGGKPGGGGGGGDVVVLYFCTGIIFVSNHIQMDTLRRSTADSKSFFDLRIFSYIALGRVLPRCVY